MSSCKRCGRKLKSQKSIDDGMGRRCKKKATQEAEDEEFIKIQMTIFDPEFTCGGVIDARTLHTSS
ncbi:hypothetical protein AN161_01110 [Lysinibacillus sp. FJAT-14222]|uniref:DUF6011 domain-containing protein n=1 Tax=Lysinibacillus agricola TaxID=2590012 RepID=UPI0006B0621E|nr:hypothetical protein AN161_01110 [Lysinibacillus sp. FJAT-14222]